VAKIIFLPILLLFGLFSLSAQAKIYKYVDEHGQVHYSSQKPSNKQYKDLQIETDSSSKKNSKTRKLKILPNHELDKAVREGRISETVAVRMRHYNSVADEYKAAKRKKKAMRQAITSAKSSGAVSAEQLKKLENDYDIFVKEDFYYAKRNYSVARQNLQSLLDGQHNNSARSPNKQKKGASIKWNRSDTE